MPHSELTDSEIETELESMGDSGVILAEAGLAASFDAATCDEAWAARSAS